LRVLPSLFLSVNSHLPLLPPLYRVRLNMFKLVLT
jgi:hypothetical protein